MRTRPRPHKFKVGQTLHFSLRHMGGSHASDNCKILRQLPFEGGEPQYRVKCSNENQERVVKELSLSRRG